MPRIALFPGTFDPITLGHVDIINRALPLFKTADPIRIPLSKKLTVPVGCGPLVATCAVNVTACPECEGLRLEINAVVVAYFLTVCVTTALLRLSDEWPK